MKKFFLFLALAFVVSLLGGLFVDVFDLSKLTGTDIILPVAIFWVMIIGGGYSAYRAYGFLSRNRD